MAYLLIAFFVCVALSILGCELRGLWRAAVAWLEGRAERRLRSQHRAVRMGILKAEDLD